jgi:hypothetical protein
MAVLVSAAREAGVPKVSTNAARKAAVSAAQIGFAIMEVSPGQSVAKTIWSGGNAAKWLSRDREMN